MWYNLHMLQLIHYVFFAYTVMIAVRIISSWFPSTQGQAWLKLLSSCTDPYLNIFRRIIPPIGGVLDLSPMLGFLVLQFLEKSFMRIFH
jgi:YggT family protein